MYRLLAAVALIFAVSLAAAQSAETAIRAAMDAQVAAWNRGDIPAFMQTYEDSPETTFIGGQLRKGYQPILQRYQQAYSNAEQMGTLSFTDLEVRMLGRCAARRITPWSRGNSICSAPPMAKRQRTTESSPWCGTRARTAGRLSWITPADAHRRTWPESSAEQLAQVVLFRFGSPVR